MLKNVPLWVIFHFFSYPSIEEASLPRVQLNIPLCSPPDGKAWGRASQMVKWMRHEAHLYHHIQSKPLATHARKLSHMRSRPIPKSYWHKPSVVGIYNQNDQFEGKRALWEGIFSSSEYIHAYILTISTIYQLSHGKTMGEKKEEEILLSIKQSEIMSIRSNLPKEVSIYLGAYMAERHSKLAHATCLHSQINISTPMH